MKNLLTVGYEGATLPAFLATLRAAGVTTLLDVRELPLSRRQGFSKRALAEALAEVGITYQHERELGSPKDIRNQLRADGDYAQYFASFKTYLKLQQPLLRELAASLQGSVALMCFERDPSTCHRSVVARHLEKLTGLTVRHLGVNHVAGLQRARHHSGQGVSAA